MLSLNGWFNPRAMNCFNVCTSGILGFEYSGFLVFWASGKKQPAYILDLQRPTPLLLDGRLLQSPRVFNCSETGNNSDLYFCYCNTRFSSFVVVWRNIIRQRLTVSVWYWQLHCHRCKSTTIPRMLAWISKVFISYFCI
jgi:hypothetical protein